MRIYDIIDKKVNGLELNKDEINFFVNGFTDGSIPDYQISSLLMAICWKGMTDDETFHLTNAMINSGERVDLSMIPGLKLDKHSTGGVGDKTSLVLCPMLVACGAKVAKASGRGLGHTGGTLDKLESIPGMNINLTSEEFINQVNKIGIAIIGQTANLCPADKKMYALRDTTCTVNSIPLIASSIMSKKIADGSDIQLLDVKYGNGAFMKDLDSARKLARLMVEMGKRAGLKTAAEITDMSQPLGMAIGNSLEVIEAVNSLRGNGPKDLMELCYESGSLLLVMAGLASNKETARKRLENSINDGSAFETFAKMVEWQGGDVSFIRDTSKFPTSKYSIQVKSVTDGYITSLNAYDLGIQAMKLGAGREKEGDLIDYAAGILLNKKLGDYVRKGEVLCTLYSERPRLNDFERDVLFDIKVGPNKPEELPIVQEDIL